MKHFQLCVSVFLSIVLCSCWVAVAGSGDAEIDPVIRDVLSGATLENNSFVNPSPNNTIELRCEVDTLRGQPHWVFFAANQSQQVVIKSTSDLFVLEENATYSILRSRPGSSPASLEGLLCCLASDGFDSEDFFAKCVQLTTKPLKGPQNVTLTVGSHAVLSNRSAGPQVVRVPKEVPLTVTCLYSNDTFPPPVVFWYPEDSNVYGDGRTLLLHNPVHNASYHCVVENQVGNVSSVQVIVQPIDAFEVIVSPSFTWLSDLDSHVILNCSYHSEFNQTVLDYVWLREGDEDTALGTSNLLTLPRSEAVGSFVCVITTSLDVNGNATATVVVTQVATLQFVVEDLVNCGYTNTPGLTVINEHLQTALVTAIRTTCNCNFTDDNIRTTDFQCYPDGQRVGVFRADVAYNATGPDDGIDALSSVLWQWVQMGQSVVVGNRRYPLSTTCAVRVSSIDDELCPYNRDVPFVITLHMVYSFAVGFGTAFFLFILLLLLCCCLVRCRHVSQMRKERKRRNAPERRPMIELVNMQGIHPPEPLDPALSVRTNTSWSSVTKDQVALKNSLSGSRESIQSDSVDVVNAAREIGQGRRLHDVDISPDSGLMPSNRCAHGSTHSLPQKCTPTGSTHSLHDNSGGRGMSASLEELADNLHHPTLESAADGYYYPVSHSLQHLTDGDRSSSLPNSPHIRARNQIKSEHFNMTATDEMLKLIEEVRAAKDAFQQILDNTPEGSPIMGRSAERTPHRTQSFREHVPYRRGNQGELRSSDPSLQPVTVRRTHSGGSRSNAPPVDGSNASMNAYWAERLRASQAKRNGGPESPSMHRRNRAEYDSLEPRTPPVATSRLRHRSDRGAYQVVSPLAKNQFGGSPPDASGDCFPPPPPPTETLRNGQIAGGPVFVPVPLAPTAAPVFAQHMHAGLSSSQPALHTAGGVPPNPPPPPPPPPPPSSTPPVIPPKMRRGASPCHVTQPVAEHSPQFSHEANLKQAIKSMQKTKTERVGAQ